MVAARLPLLLPFFLPLFVCPISGSMMDERSDDVVYDPTFGKLDRMSTAGTALWSAASGLLFPPAPAAPVAPALGGVTAAIRSLLMLQTASLAFEEVAV